MGTGGCLPATLRKSHAGTRVVIRLGFGLARTSPAPARLRHASNGLVFALGNGHLALERSALRFEMGEPAALQLLRD